MSIFCLYLKYLLNYRCNPLRFCDVSLCLNLQYTKWSFEFVRSGLILANKFSKLKRNFFLFSTTESITHLPRNTFKKLIFDYHLRFFWRFHIINVRLIYSTGNTYQGPVKFIISFHDRIHCDTVHLLFFFFYLGLTYILYTFQQSPLVLMEKF